MYKSIYMKNLELTSEGFALEKEIQAFTIDLLNKFPDSNPREIVGFIRDTATPISNNYILRRKSSSIHTISSLNLSLQKLEDKKQKLLKHKEKLETPE